MAKGEGLIRSFEPISNIKTELLETFPYMMKDVKFQNSGDSQCEIIEDTTIKHLKEKIYYKTSELSAVCPYSGLPDIGILEVYYIPNKKVVELKSFKYYLTSFRNVGIYQEHLTQRIYTDLLNVLEPLELEIKTIYNTRGGIDTTCVISSKDQMFS